MKKRSLSPCTLKQCRPASTRRQTYRSRDCCPVERRTVSSAFVEALRMTGHEISSAAQLRALLLRQFNIDVTYAAVFFTLRRHPSVFCRFNPMQNGTVCYNLNAVHKE